MKMLTIALLIGALAVTTACSASALEPIPGSITFGGQPRTKLAKAPIGSTVTHQFYDRFGKDVHEVYRIDENRDLRLIRRRIRDD